MKALRNQRKKKSSPTPKTEISKRKFYVPESPTAPYRSLFEQEVAKDLEQKGCEFDYEPLKIEYTLECKYTPDFVLPNGIIVETKGRLSSKDARKHRAIKKQNPDLDIRFVFMRLKERVEGSKLTNEKWCLRYKFLYAEKLIPLSWIEE